MGESRCKRCDRKHVDHGAFLILHELVSGPSPGEGLFPHLYGGKLGKDEVERVMTLNKGSGWDSVLEEAEDWLVY